MIHKNEWKASFKEKEKTTGKGRRTDEKTSFIYRAENIYKI